MIRQRKRISWILALVPVLTGWADGGALTGTNVVTLARHETVAEFRGTNYHRCLGRTALCPDQCGESGAAASFKVTKYLSYKKLGEHGDPKCDQFAFMIEGNMKNPKVPSAIRDVVRMLAKGDLVFLSWNHDYVTVDGSSGPKRPIVKLEKIAPIGTKAWMEQVDRVVGTKDAAGHGPTIDSDEWMIAVSRKLGVFDAQGHGPDLRSKEWVGAIQRKTFGNEPSANQ
ncbi:MAG: hypothetical protein NTV49_12255 [Kiritimatiellaeota bacterium]|nr:hypothetical protein [Kiritimatiellota bacterium]